MFSFVETARPCCVRCIGAVAFGALMATWADAGACAQTGAKPAIAGQSAATQTAPVPASDRSWVAVLPAGGVRVKVRPAT